MIRDIFIFIGMMLEYEVVAVDWFYQKFCKHPQPMIHTVLSCIGRILEVSIIAVAWVFTLILALAFAPFVLVAAFLTRNHKENLLRGRYDGAT